MSLVSFVKSTLVALTVALFTVAAAPRPAAAQMDTFVVVPDVPGGANFSGCYRGSPRLWDRYRLDFCLTQRASYTVTGRGLNCNGRVTWRARGSEIFVSLQRTSCGNGVAWAAAEMTCRGGSLIGNIIGQLLPGVRPSLQTLRCTYFPSVRAYPNQSITARRTN